MKILILILMTLFLGCSKKESVEKVITVAQSSKPRSLDPYKFNEFPALIITEHMYNTLITLNDEGEIVPELATKWEYLSPTEILFHLRDDVTFHNGNKFSADDVVYSLMRMKNSPGSAAMVDLIESVTKVDDEKVAVKLKGTSAPFLGTLASPLAAIMDKEYSEVNEEKLGVAPMGTGPFRFGNWDNTDKIVLAKNMDYFGEVPKIDKLVFWIITEAANRVIALETGEADIATAISPIDAEKLKDNSKLRLETKLTATTDFLAFNVSKKYMDNVNVRKAISLAIDKAGIVDSIYFGRGLVANSIVNPKIWGSFDKEFRSEYNIEKAKELLKDVNLEELNLNFWTSDNATRQQIAQIIQANLKEIGINSTITPVESGAFLQKTANGEHDFLLNTWFIGAPDADTILRVLLYGKSIGSGGNRSFYNNPKVNELIELAATNLDSEKRLAAYKEIQEILNDEMPVVPLVHKFDTMAFSNKVKNYKYNKATLRNLFEVIEKE